MNPRAGYAVCGGGTGGHIFPALAVAQELRLQVPDAPVYFIGKEKSMEQDLAQRQQLPFYGLPAAGLVRKISLENVAVAWKTVAGFWQARRVLKKLSVKAVLGTGGFVCGPVVLAARTLGIPSLIHESNLVPGLTNRMLSGVATAIAVGQEQSLKHFPAGKTVVTGFPLRPGLNRPTHAEGCEKFGLNPAQPVLFVFPGSLAARRINRAVAEALPQLARRMPELQILWMTGKSDLSLALRIKQQFRLPVEIREFIFEVPEAYAAADLVLARSGAGTLAELSATGKPALLVPYPFATDNHQVFNAALLQQAGAAEVVADEKFDGGQLLLKLPQLFQKLATLKAKAEAVRAAYPAHAAREMARMMIEMGER